MTLTIFLGNTISNVIMIIPGFVGALYYWKKGFEFRYVLSNLFLLGQLYFLSTQKYQFVSNMNSFMLIK